MDSIEQKALECIKKVIGKEIELRDNFKEKGINSIQYIKITVECELEFGVTFTNKELVFEKIQTVQEFVNLLKMKLQ